MTYAPWILLAEAEGGQLSPETTAFLTSLFTLMLATFIGLEVIKNVSRLLHTPLMSLTNAISAIAVVGSIVLAGQKAPSNLFTTILGPLNLPAEVPQHASQMYAKNISTFLLNLVKDKQVQINLEDEIIRDTLIARDGQIVHARIQQLLVA